MRPRPTNLFADDNPLEAWLAHCCWGKGAYSGKGQITDQEGEKQAIEYAAWKQNPDDEIACALPLVVGFKVEATWTDWQTHQNIRIGDTPLHHQNERLKLSVIVPPFNHGKVVLDLRFMDTQYQWRTFIGKDKPGQTWHSKSALTAQGQAATGGPVPTVHTWTIDQNDLPPGAVQAEARVCFDPHGNGKHLLPHNRGLLLTAIKGNSTDVSSI